jgi:nicotinamidase/pyrazinamidase
MIRQASAAVTPESGDALLIVDVQNDFLPGGRLAVPQGNAVVAPLNRCIAAFERRGRPVIATRDWHPPKHCSFEPQGGPWPPHCVAGTHGAEFAPQLRLPATAVVVSKGTAAQAEAYSGFQGTDLAARLQALRVRRLFIGGLATDYCVLHTVRDALRAGFEVAVLADAVAAVDCQQGDGGRALEDMQRLGARLLRSAGIEA